MLKYTEAKVTFSEVPDEISLCINISNCPCHCKGCHSSYLAEDIGVELGYAVIAALIEANKGISCVAFMGGDASPKDINLCATFIKSTYPDIKVAWYSGRQGLSPQIDLWNFDYIKLGPYKGECSPLDKITTNQKFYKVVHTSTGVSKLLNITYKFWKHD